MKKYIEEKNWGALFQILLALVFIELLVYAWIGPSATPPGGAGEIVYDNVNKRIGIGTGVSTPGSVLSVSGGVSVGKAFASFAAPSDGMIVEGNVGIGTINPVAKFHVANGGYIINGITQRANPNERVAKGNTITDTGLAATLTNTSVTIGIDGLPLIAYIEGPGATNLKLVECHNIICTSFSAKTVVSGLSGGSYPSMVIGADGNPVIAYGAIEGTNALFFVKCQDPKCIAVAAPIRIETGLDPKIYTSLTMGADGFPIIAYGGNNDSGENNLTIIKCRNLTCASRTETEIPNPLPSSIRLGKYNSITIGIDGLPVVATQGRVSPTYLHFIHCITPDCIQFEGPFTIDQGLTSSGAGQNASLLIGGDGYPVIAYYDSFDSSLDLRVGKCFLQDCNVIDPSSYQAVNVDTVGDVGDFSSLTIGVDGFPVIAYHDTGNGDLKIAKCGSDTCNLATFSVVDFFGIVGKFNSITIGTDGLPLVVYIREDGGSRLKVLHCGSYNCVPYWTRR